MNSLRLLVLNLCVDEDDPVLGFTASWIQRFASVCEEVHVITMTAGRFNLPGNVTVFSIGKERGYSEPRRLLEFYRHLLRLVRRRQVNVCFSHMAPLFSALAGPVLRAAGIPLITWYAHPALTLTLRVAHQMSVAMVTSFETTYPFRSDKVHVIGQGIDVAMFSAEDRQPATPPLIVCVGRLSRAKDQLTLVRAARILADRTSIPFRVTFIGEVARPEDAVYAAALHEESDEDIVEFIGGVKRSELPGWYKRAAIHVNLTPSGFGDKVALESMSCGTPTIVANAGLRELLGPHASMLLFRHGDPQDLAQKLALLLSNSAAANRQLGLALRDRIVTHHSLDSLTTRLRRIWLDTLAAKRHDESTR